MGKPTERKALTPEQKRVQELKAQVARLEREETILKRIPLS
jgi:transposase